MDRFIFSAAGNLIAIHKISNEAVCKIQLQLTVQRLPLTFTSIANDFFPHLPSAWSFLMIGDCNEKRGRKVQGFHFVEAFSPKEMVVPLRSFEALTALYWYC